MYETRTLIRLLSIQEENMTTNNTENLTQNITENTMTNNKTQNNPNLENTMPCIQEVPFAIRGQIKLFRDSANLYLDTIGNDQPEDIFSFTDEQVAWCGKWTVLLETMSTIKYYPELSKEDWELIRKVESTMTDNFNDGHEEPDEYPANALGSVPYFHGYKNRLKKLVERIVSPKGEPSQVCMELYDLMLEYIVMYNYSPILEVCISDMDTKKLLRTIVGNYEYIKQHSIGATFLATVEHLDMPPIWKAVQQVLTTGEFEFDDSVLGRYQPAHWENT